MLAVRFSCRAALIFLYFLSLSNAHAQTDFSWNGSTGLYSNAGQWTPAGGPPTNVDRALFQTGTSFTVSGNGGSLQTIVDVSDATFTGVISPVGSVTSTAFLVGDAATGQATFSGSGATLNAGTAVQVGNSATGTLIFTGGATGSSQGAVGIAAANVGLNSGGNGTLTVTGTGSTYTTTGSLDLAFAPGSVGVVNVADGAHLDTNGSLALASAGMNIAVGANTTGTVNISGDATVHNELQTNLGLGGRGTVNISSGSYTTTDGGTANPALSIARLSGSEGDLNVSGTGLVTTEGQIIVGGDGTGRMTITDEGLVQSNVTVGAPALVGFGSFSLGNVFVEGTDAKWNVTDALIVGQSGSGNIDLTDGGTLFIEDTATGGNPFLFIGDSANSFGAVNVLDAGSFLDASFIPVTIGRSANSSGVLSISDDGEAFIQRTTVGDAGFGEVFVETGGVLTTGTFVAGAQSGGEGLVDFSEGATIDVLGQLIIGQDGLAEVSLSDATLTVLEFMTLGQQAGSQGTMFVDASTSTSVGGALTALTVGDQGTGDLSISGSSTFTVQGPTEIAAGSNALGIMNVGFSSSFTTASTLTVGDEGTAIFDTFGTTQTGTAFIAKTGGFSMATVSGSTWTVTNAGTDNGSVFVGGSDTAVGGTGELFVAGTLTVNNRVKIWNGSFAQLTGGTINAAAIEVLGDLRGNGTVNATMTTLSGVIAPRGNGGFTDRLTINSDLVFDASGRFQVEIGGTIPATEYDMIDVTGDVTLDGFLDVFLIGGFTLSPGLTFDILNVTGTLTGLIESHAEGSVVGTFGGIDLFITYAGGGISLFTAAGGVVDVDNDNDVDGADFLALQRTNSSLIPDWQLEYGTTPTVATNMNVPEPAPVVLVFLMFTVVSPLRLARHL